MAKRIAKASRRASTMRAGGRRLVGRRPGAGGGIKRETFRSRLRKRLIGSGKGGFKILGRRK